MLFFLLVLILACSYFPEDLNIPVSVDVQYSRKSIIVIDRTFESGFKTGFVLYPGGLVDAAAYIPLAVEMASRGIPVIIVRFLSNLAVFNPDIAVQFAEESALASRWVLGGHSLGGAMAADCVYDNFVLFDGLILLAAYPPDSVDLSAWNKPVLILSGEFDLIADKTEIENSFNHLPPLTKELATIPDFTFSGEGESIYHIIQGANHSGFACYGHQSGDGEAEISATRQQQITADYIEHFFMEAGL